MRGYLTALVVAFVVLSALADSGGATQRVITGTVTEFQAGEWLSIVSEMTDPTGLQFALRPTTAYEGREHDSVREPVVIKPGVRVTIWYRSVGERRPVADKVRVVPD